MDGPINEFFSQSSFFPTPASSGESFDAGQWYGQFQKDVIDAPRDPDAVTDHELMKMRMAVGLVEAIPVIGAPFLAATALDSEASTGNRIFAGVGAVASLLPLFGVIASEGASVARGASESFQILDGVRRAKAAQLSGLETIAAEVEVGGRTVSTGQVPIASLRSPKGVIDTVSSPSGLSRWTNTLRQTAGGSPPPPIRITPGATGTPINLVRVGKP